MRWATTATQNFGIEEGLLAAGLINVLNALAESTGRVIYVSSTGVYGDCGGQWIDEHTPASRNAPEGRACLSAEGAWLSSHPRAQMCRDRLAWRGSDGPGRIPNREALEAGARRFRASAAGWLNSIHVDDAVPGHAGRRAHAEPGSHHYLVSDGCPVARPRLLPPVGPIALKHPPPQFASCPTPRSRRPFAPRATNGSATPDCSASWVSISLIPRFARVKPDRFGRLSHGRPAGIVRRRIAFRGADLEVFGPPDKISGRSLGLPAGCAWRLKG